MSDRLPVPESLEQAFEASKYSPSDYELAQKRARGWEKLTQQAKRKRFFHRWMPMAGVLASAAAAALIFAPNWSGADPAAGPQTGIPSLSQPEQEGERQDEGKDAVRQPPSDIANEYHIRDMKNKLYREQGYELVYYNSALSYDVIRDGEAFYLARDGEEKQRLFKAPTRDINLVQAQDPYLVFQYGGAVQDGEQMPVWLVNAEDLTVKELLLEGNWSSGLTIWKEQGRTQLVYLGYISGSKDQKVYSYDLQTGETKVILEHQEAMFNAISSFAGQLTLSNRFKVLLRHEGGWRTVAESPDGGVEIVSKSSDQILYVTGAGLNGLSPGGDSYYKGTMKLHRYEVAAGQSKPMLPGVEGNQMMVIDLQSEGRPELVLSSFALEPGKQQGKDTKGTLTLWRAVLGKEPVRIFEKRGVRFGDSLLMRQSYAEGAAEKDIYIGAQTAQKWQLRYQVQTGTVEEVAPYTENP